MTGFSAQEAFKAYEAVRHRLPDIEPNDVSYRRIETLSEVMDEFDVFLLDAFGVLNIGETAIPETPERIKSLTDAGKRVLVVPCDGDADTVSFPDQCRDGQQAKGDLRQRFAG